MIDMEKGIRDFSNIFEIGFESYYTLSSRTVICADEARLHKRISISEHDELPHVFGMTSLIVDRCCLCKCRRTCGACSILDASESLGCNRCPDPGHKHYLPYAAL
jgi:hypothetical protein